MDWRDEKWREGMKITLDYNFYDVRLHRRERHFT